MEIFDKQEGLTVTRLPFVPGVSGTPFQKTLANNPAVRAGFTQLSGANAATLNDPELFELLRLRIASNNGCEY